VSGYSKSCHIRILYRKKTYYEYFIYKKCAKIDASCFQIIIITKYRITKEKKT